MHILPGLLHHYRLRDAERATAGASTAAPPPSTHQPAWHPRRTCIHARARTCCTARWAALHSFTHAEIDCACRQLAHMHAQAHTCMCILDQPQAARRRRDGDEECQAVGAALLGLLHGAPRDGALLLHKVRQLESRAAHGGEQRGFDPSPSLNPDPQLNPKPETQPQPE